MATIKTEQEKAVRKYLKTSADLMASGVATPELSYHQPMGAMLEAIGEALSSSFHCVSEGGGSRKWQAS